MRQLWLGAIALVLVAARARAADKDDARARFERGLAFHQEKKLDAALAEFVASLTLYPTRAAAFNAGRVYKELRRYDEALELFTSIPKRFPDLSAADRAELERETRELASFVGTIAVEVAEADASIAIDGRERPNAGTRTYPISVGTHVVRVFKEGFLPFETRVDVAAMTTVRVTAKLGALTQGGRLTVTEDRGGKVTVVVDGIDVGQTPWEGTVAVGPHVVALRGDGRLGAPPTPVDVKRNQLSKLSLVAEPLTCALRVEPVPRTAHVAVDGVELGSGVWDGPLRCGGHQIEIAAEGFVSRRRTVTLVEGPALLAREPLDRDPTSPLWQAKNPPRIFVEGGLAALVSPGMGGDLSSFAIGGAASARAGYRLGLGLGASVDLGFLGAASPSSSRDTETRPYGLPAHPGRAEDRLVLSGPMLGASASYVVGARRPIVARLGAGVLLGTVADRRSGTFTTPGGARYDLPGVEQSPSTTAMYVDPEVRMAFPLFRGGTFEVGARALVVVPLGGPPRWSDATELSLGACPSPDRNVCSGRGVYASQELTSSLFVYFGPSAALRFEW